jgi:transcriptional regulator with XRE-family HTH domain
LTVKQKYDLVQEAEKKTKPTQKELGIKFGIEKTTVSDILKRKSE